MDSSPKIWRCSTTWQLPAGGRRARRSPCCYGAISATLPRGKRAESLSALRGQLGDHIDIEHEQVELNRPWCDVDIWRFVQLAKEGMASGDRTCLQAAIELYRGDLLAGFAVRNAPDYDLWLSSTQERLRGIAVQAMDSLSTHHAGDGDLNAAIDLQRRILELEPWREETHRTLMLLLAQNGERSAAIAQYKACVASLAEELGVEPAAETTALAARLRDAHAVFAPPVRIVHDATTHTRAAPVPVQAPLRNNLPLALSPIVGREQELADLAALLATPDCRLVTIFGPGGIGKTRLALALAHNLSDGFEAAVLVALAPVDRADGILTVAGSALGFAPGAQPDAVLEALHNRNPHLLLVLDNFEQLLPEGALVLESILNAAPRDTLHRDLA